jgi:nucleotide-binding universal stress UspA family protein
MTSIEFAINPLRGEVVFERIIVALDGSRSSEAALPAAEELARRLGSSLILLHVVEPRPPESIHGERHIATVPEAEAYLSRIVARLESSGLRASFHVHADPGRQAPGSRGVVEAVAAHEAELGGGLAVMAAHGRSGISEALTGALPQKVAAAGGAAVLLVPRAEGSDRTEGPATAFAPRRLVVPLDGRAGHEAALPAAVVLARAFGIGVSLIAAVPRRASEAGGPGAVFARLAPALTGESLELAAGISYDYLRGVAGRLGSEGVAAEFRVARGRPAKTIVASCAEGDLLVVSTHRKIGIDASLDGCVAFDAARSWRGPTLVVPLPRERDR